MKTHYPCALFAQCSLIAYSNVVAQVADGSKPLSYLKHWYRVTVGNAKRCLLLVQDGEAHTYVPVSKSWVNARIGRTVDGLFCSIEHRHCAHGVVVVSLQEDNTITL